MKIKAILTGATGMVGEGVLHECLHHEAVDQVLVIGRRPSDIQDPRLEEIVHTNFFDLSAIESRLSGYDACFFCLGVSSVGMREDEYYRLTYMLTMHVAQTLSRINPDMVFCYISGAGTDSTEKGRTMWARVKGKTENDLMKLHFKQVYNFRPGIIEPTRGLKNTLGLYKYLGWLIPIIRFFSPNLVSSLRELGLAMINAVLKNYDKHIIEVKDIHALAKQ